MLASGVIFIPKDKEFFSVRKNAFLLNSLQVHSLKMCFPFLSFLFYETLET